MIVELAGIPGSGKSTVAALLAARLARVGCRVSSPILAIAAMPVLLRVATKAAYVVRYLTFRPVRALRLLAAVLRSRQRSPGDLARVAVNALLVASIADRRRRWRRRGGRLLLLDQGGVQALVSILASARSRERVRPASGRWGPLLGADRCLVLCVEASEAARRLEGRPGRSSRLERAPRLSWLGELERMGQDIDAVARAARDRHGVRVDFLGPGEIAALSADPQRSLGLLL